MPNVVTPLYMSPEVVEGHYDNKINVYSFGIPNQSRYQGL
jgi:serine/threonine protein kinase